MSSARGAPGLHVGACHPGYNSVVPEVAVGPSSQFPPGTVRRVVVTTNPETTLPLLVVTAADGSRGACSAVCPHEDVELWPEDVELPDAPATSPSRVHCSGHGYEFELEHGACRPDARLRLAIYEVREQDGWVLVRWPARNTGG